MNFFLKIKDWICLISEIDGAVRYVDVKRRRLEVAVTKRSSRYRHDVMTIVTTR